MNICYTYSIYYSQDKGDTSPILLSPDSGHCSSSHSIGMNVNHMVNTSRICKSISLQFPRWRDPHHLLFDAEKVSKSDVWCFESLKTRSLSGWQQHGFLSPAAPTSPRQTSPGPVVNFHPTDKVSRYLKACLDLQRSIFMLNIFSSGSIATTPALSLEEEDYDWGTINILELSPLFIIFLLQFDNIF